MRPYALAVQPDGRALIAGTQGIGDSDHNFVVTRLAVDGSGIDLSFGQRGSATIAFDVAEDGNNQDDAFALGLAGGRIAVAGLARFEDDDFGVARLDNDGMWSDGFEAGTTFFWSGQR